MINNNNLFWEKQNKIKSLNNYPWDQIVTFIKNLKVNFKKKKIKLLELGCGSGGNLLFASKEGIETYGLDISKSALDNTLNLFKKEKLKVTLFNSSFEKIPTANLFFNIIIDRASLTCVSFDSIILSLIEVNRTLKKKGLFYFNPYSKKHTSYNYSKSIKINNVYQYSHKISKGSLSKINQICFFDLRMIKKISKLMNWEIISINHIIKKDVQFKINHSEWQIIFKK